MKIRKEDFQSIFEYLVKKRGEGDEFVAFPDVPYPAGKEELFTFRTLNEAKEFCHEISTDIDIYDFLAIRSAYRAMSEAANNRNNMISNNGLIDVSLMIEFHYQRLETELLFNNKKSIMMNQKNLDYLNDQVKYSGFGEGLEKALKEKMEKELPEFTLTHQGSFGKDMTASVLHFKKSNQSDMYFFNSYKMSLKNERKPGIMEQTFYINKSNNITLKEAYNLMKGRSVNKDLINKEGQMYNAWVKMDFKQTTPNGNFKLQQFHQNYGYDLEKSLGRHPIKELSQDEDKARLLASLKKGNRQSVTFDVDGKDQKRYIEANPRFKTINIYDSDMQRVNNRQSKKEEQSVGESNAKKQSTGKNKEAAEDEEPDMPKKTKKRRKAQSVS